MANTITINSDLIPWGEVGSTGVTVGFVYIRTLLQNSRLKRLEKDVEKLIDKELLKGESNV